MSLEIPGCSCTLGALSVGVGDKGHCASPGSVDRAGDKHLDGCVDGFGGDGALKSGAATQEVLLPFPLSGQNHRAVKELQCCHKESAQQDRST